MTSCPYCAARVRWAPDESVELNVSGTVADEVESLTRQLSAELVPSHVTTETPKVIPNAQARWAKSRKAWAFAIGLATIAGGVAAVLALVIH